MLPVTQTLQQGFLGGGSLGHHHDPPSSTKMQTVETVKWQAANLKFPACLLADPHCLITDQERGILRPVLRPTVEFPSLS